MGAMRHNVAAAFSVRRSCQGQAPLHQASVARTSTAVGDRGAAQPLTLSAVVLYRCMWSAVARARQSSPTSFRSKPSYRHNHRKVSSSQSPTRSVACNCLRLRCAAQCRL